MKTSYIISNNTSILNIYALISTTPMSSMQKQVLLLLIYSVA